MNWVYIIIGGATAEIALLMFVYHLTTRRSDATIKTLEAHNKWLKEQLDQAKEQSPDILVKSLSERKTLLEAELTNLVLDRETNKTEIQKKQAEIEHNKQIAEQINEVMQEFRKRYNELKKKVDVCPYCDAGLVELKDVHDGDWTGSHRRYECGYTILDGERVYFCPSDPEYPNFDEEFEVEYQGRIIGGGWTAYSFPKTAKARMVEQIAAFGKTQDSALQNLREAYYQNPAKTETDVPTF